MGSIDVKTAIDLCDAYGGLLEDFEKVLVIEDIMYPWLVAKAKAEAEASAKARQSSGTNKPTVH